MGTTKASSFSESRSSRPTTEDAQPQPLKSGLFIRLSSRNKGPPAIFPFVLIQPVKLPQLTKAFPSRKGLAPSNRGSMIHRPRGSTYPVKAPRRAGAEPSEKHSAPSKDGSAAQVPSVFMSPSLSPRRTQATFSTGSKTCAYSKRAGEITSPERRRYPYFPFSKKITGKSSANKRFEKAPAPRRIRKRMNAIHPKYRSDLRIWSGQTRFPPVG